MGKFTDFSGQKFGRLTVLYRVENDKNGNSRFVCKCDCGKEKTVLSQCLRSGRTKSCGCFSREISAINCEKLGRASKTHGLRSTRLYHVWNDMKTRCYNKNALNYNDYGGRGITICDEWRNDFKAFYDWAMANGYDENAPRGTCTIDRVDNNKGYSPDNCRWVSVRVQNNNKRNGKPFTYEDVEYKSRSEASRQLGIPKTTLFQRKNKKEKSKC